MADRVQRLNAALEGRYRIEGELGEGGMARVYLARDLRHDRDVALKVLKSELAAVVGAERFLAEIKTTANLQHPNILPLFDSGRVRDRERLFDAHRYLFGFPPNESVSHWPAYDLAPDDGRFLMMREAAEAPEAEGLRLIYVQNFTEELEEMARDR